MTELNLELLTKKLDATAIATLEESIAGAMNQTHYYVEIEHFLVVCLRQADKNFMALIAHCQLEQATLASSLQARLDKFKSGSQQAPGLSQLLVQCLKEAWMQASLEFSAKKINLPILIYTLIGIAQQQYPVMPLPGGLEKVSLQRLADFVREDQKNDAGETTSDAQGPLDKFATNLTLLAKQNKIDPIIGRHVEVRQMIDVLTRRKQNNPLLVGEAGVGKTAIVEGLALRIVANDVPPELMNTSIYNLDLASLQAGAGVKGEFEKRLQAVINAVKNAATPIILFIDEAHNLIGAGNQAGQGDAANLLKPALARGELKTIAATTWSEYKKYFEKDSALNRRFQLVQVDEPSVSVAIAMMRGVLDTLESHHNVVILDEAIRAAVNLSKRYITSRCLPDKCMSLLDTAAARVHLSQTATPASIEDLTKESASIQATLNKLNQEQKQGLKHNEQIAVLENKAKKNNEQRDKLIKRWKKELKVIRDIATLKKKLATQLDIDSDLQKKLVQKRNVLKTLQKECPLIHDCVDANIIAKVISDWTGIPVGNMNAGDAINMINLEARLHNLILGQDQAINTIAKQLKVSHASLQDPNKPRGVFLLVGTSGVGKTETALNLAKLVYGGEKDLTIINMSEFKEPHKLSMLTGSPAGYVGYGEGGILTEAVRRNPYSVILLDEMEKAHPSIQEAFYQVFDKGIMMDGEGRVIDFKNVLIIMTSNLGSVTLSALQDSDDESLRHLPDELERELLTYFKPAFLGRVSIVPYLPLDVGTLKNIVKQKFSQIQQRALQQHQCHIEFSPAVMNRIISQANHRNSGARRIDHVINQRLLPGISEQFLCSFKNKQKINTLKIGVNKAKDFTYKS